MTLDIESAKNVTMPETGPDGKQQLGGLVVKNCDGNNAPREEIVLRAGRAAPSAASSSRRTGGPVGPDIHSQFGGSPIAFDGTSNVFPVNALPKHLWVRASAKALICATLG